MSTIGFMIVLREIEVLSDIRLYLVCKFLYITIESYTAKKSKTTSHYFLVYRLIRAYSNGGQYFPLANVLRGKA